jgi:hypothetical protein
MTAADALALIDQVYADRRRESLTMLLSAPGIAEADTIDEIFAEQDRAFAEERERFAKWLETLHDGPH